MTLCFLLIVSFLHCGQLPFLGKPPGSQAAKEGAGREGDREGVKETDKVESGSLTQ